MSLFARGCTVLVYVVQRTHLAADIVPSLSALVVPFVQCLVLTGNVPICPCPYCACCTVARLAAENVPSFSALVRTGTPCTVLGPHGQCTYLSVSVLCGNRRGCTVLVSVVQRSRLVADNVPSLSTLIYTGILCTVPAFGVARAGNVPICPWLYCTCIRCTACSLGRGQCT